MNPFTLSKYLAGTALAVSIASIGYLVLGRQPTEGSVSELSMKVSRIELGLAALKEENRALKEEGQMMKAALETTHGTASQDEESPASESAARENHSAASFQPAPGSVGSAHRHWVAAEYLEIIEKSQANTNSMISVLSSETSIPKDKLVPMKSVFSEASIRVANALAASQDMNDVQAMNSKISEIDRWKDEALSALLSKEEFEQYKSINWMKKLGSGDRK